MDEKKMIDTKTRAPVSQQAQQVTKATDAGMIGATVSVNIDGVDMKVPMGTTILEAAKQAGIRIPTLCWHEDLCIAGMCRVCVVEVEGQRALQASCAYPITSPIKVATHTRKVRQARRHIVDLLLANHYGECYACVRNNNCELQSLAKEYGVDMFRFGHPDKPMVAKDHSSHSVFRDMNKCVLCRRCVRTCIDLQEVGVLEAVFRGNETKIATFMDKPLAEVVCSFSNPAGENTTEIVAEKGSVIQNYGDGVSCNVPRAGGPCGLKWFLRQKGEWVFSDIESPTDHGARIHGLARPLSEFLHGRRPPIATAEEGRTSLRMLLACYVSSREGRRVRFDDDAIARV